MSNSITNWIAEAKSFKAYIHCQSAWKYWDDTQARYKDIMTFDSPGIDEPVRLSDASGFGLEEGWLITGRQAAPTTFNIEYHSETTDRIHVYINGTGTDSDRKVEISRNGYLGLYRTNSPVDLIKLEPLEWGPDTLRCRLRDHTGRTVKTLYHMPPDSNVYLNTNDGDIATFLITRR